MFFCQLFNYLMFVWSDYMEFNKTAKSTYILLKGCGLWKESLKHLNNSTNIDKTDNTSHPHVEYKKNTTPNDVENPNDVDNISMDSTIIGSINTRS
jgi:hypothetical protein